MGAFSVWHWLIVVVIVGLVVLARKPKLDDAHAAAGIHVHTATQYVCASLHSHRIDPLATIDRLRDRHKAKLPELGLNTGRILSEAITARRRRTAFAFASLAVFGWIVTTVLGHLPDAAGVLRGEAGTLESLLADLVPPLLVMASIGFVERIGINAYLKARIVPLTDGPDHDTQQNVIIFGGFSPFAGYGNDQDGWSLAIDAAKASDGHAGPPVAFEPVELLDHVSRELEANVVLGDSFDRLFVNGRRIRSQKLFLYSVRSMPNTAISPAIMRAKIGRPDQDGRHYRVFSSSFAGGHLHLTYFFRSTMVGAKLFIEQRCFLLPPIRPEFTELNELPVRHGVIYHLREFGRALVAAPVDCVAGPVFLAKIVMRFGAKLAHAVLGDPEDKLKQRQETYNYGQSRSLREGWSSQLFHTYFQMLDKDMVGKTCQHIIINAIVDFLESRGIATDDIKERRSQIFNSGVIVSGGVINAQQMSVGQGAKASARFSNVKGSA